MSTRIERVWGTVLGQSQVKRKELADRDGSANQQYKQPDKDQKDQEEASSQPVDRQTVEKAMSDLRSSDGFNQTGMKVEVLETKDGLRVRLAQAGGATVKIMSAEEFMKLRENSAGQQIARGKILDQKF